MIALRKHNYLSSAYQDFLDSKEVIVVLTITLPEYHRNLELYNGWGIADTRNGSYYFNAARSSIQDFRDRAKYGEIPSLTTNKS